jgi:glycerol dehydrogenase-like iron-containing ADH family enzyme
MSDMQAMEATDRAVAASIGDAVAAVNTALDNQRQDQGNGSDPNDTAVLANLQNAQGFLAKAQQSQQADMAAWPEANE